MVTETLYFSRAEVKIGILMEQMSNERRATFSNVLENAYAHPTQQDYRHCQYQLRGDYSKNDDPISLEREYPQSSLTETGHQCWFLV